jgi:hypothetical protein
MRRTDRALRCDEGETTDTRGEGGQRIDATDPAVNRRRLGADGADQLDGPEQKQDRTGEEVHPDSGGRDGRVRLVQPGQRLVPVLQRIGRNGTAIEGEDVEAEDSGACPDGSDQGDGRQAQRGAGPPRR